VLDDLVSGRKMIERDPFRPSRALAGGDSDRYRDEVIQALRYRGRYGYAL